KLDFDFYPAPRHKMKFGGLFTHHTFVPNILDGNQGEVRFEPVNDTKKFATELAMYFQDEWDVSDRINMNIGARYSSFSQLGPYTIYNRDDNGNKLDSIVQGRGPFKTYGGIEPRVTFRYSINEETSV